MSRIIIKCVEYLRSQSSERRAASAEHFAAGSHLSSHAAESSSYSTAQRCDAIVEYKVAMPRYGCFGHAHAYSFSNLDKRRAHSGPPLVPRRRPCHAAQRDANKEEAGTRSKM